jgi:hypothetical protein
MRCTEQAGDRTAWDTAALVRDQHPEAAESRDRQGKLPVDWAVVRGGRQAGGGLEWRWKNQFAVTRTRDWTSQ